MDTEEMTASEIVEKVAALNDAFRKQSSATYVVTPGILDSLDLQEVITRVREYDDFSEDNDPYGEHDFGNFEMPLPQIVPEIEVDVENPIPRLFMMR